MHEKRNKLFLLILISIGSMTTPFMGASVNLALPSIGKEFNMNAITLGWVATSFLLSTAAVLLPIGRLADIFGRTKLFKSGMLVYTITSFLCGFAPTGEILILIRVVQGIGAAMLFSTSTAILVSAFPLEERGKVLGVNVAAVYIGLSAGPFFGGMITQQLGWRALFYINGAIGLFVLVLIPFLLKAEWADAKGEKFDFLGSGIYAVALIALMYGFSILPGAAGFFLVLIGLAGFTCFISYESKLQAPILNIGLLKTNRTFAFSNLAALINYASTNAVGFLLSFYLQYIKGLTPQAAGFILVSQPVMMAIFSPMAGRLSDKREPQLIATIGMTLTTVGLSFLIFITPETSFTYIIGSLLVLGFGYSLFSSPNNNAVLSSVQPKHLGIASSTLSTMRLLGQMLSMGFAMLIFSLIIGQVKISQNNHDALLLSIRIAFILFTLLCFGGIFASHSRGKMRNR
jgi:EmrB/QacA subfamily drug resistance transporter